MSAREDSITWRNPARLLPADAVSAETLRGAVNAACAAQHSPSPLPIIDAERWHTYLRDHGVDLRQSALLQRAGEVMAFVLVTPRPHQRTRIALFGTVPSQRGRGFAARLLEEVLASANARRETSVELEVAAQNHSAMKTCWARGFKPQVRLYGFSNPGDAPAHSTVTADELLVTRVSATEASEWLHDLDALDPQELPWPVSAAALPQRRSVQAWRCERAQLAFETVAGVKLRVWSLVDRDPEQRGATQLLATLRAQFPDATLKTLPVFRHDGAARAFEALGWRRQAHYQWWLQWAMCG